MFFKKGSRGDGSLLQNQFTAYLVTSVRRRKNEIMKARLKHQEREVYVDLEEYFYALSAPEPPLEDLVSDEAASFDDMYFENKVLERAVEVIRT